MRYNMLYGFSVFLVIVVKKGSSFDRDTQVFKQFITLHSTY